MQDNLTNFLTDRPLFGHFKKDQFDIPIPKLEHYDIHEIDNCSISSISNLKSARGKRQKIVSGFASDKLLNSIWNHPFRLSKAGKNYFAVMTPDMSINPSMDKAQIIFATYQNRWMGCFLQQYGIRVLISVSWALPDSYDICLNSIPFGSPVAVSTLGCHKESSKKIFLDGLNEVKKRVNPPFIVLFGRPIPGMTGEYVNFWYEDMVNANTKYQQTLLFPISKIINLEEAR